MARRVVVAGAVVFAACATCAAVNAQVGGNVASADALQHEARLREFQQYQLDTRFKVNPDIPPGQRYYFDYGAFVQFNYLSLDDPENENHVLRETDFVPYARLNIDGAHEIFVRGRWGWRDFNDGDSFDGRGDEPVDGDVERGYYRFDYQRANAAYGNLGPDDTNDFQFIFQGGRDLAYWANGLVLGQTLDGVSVTLGNVNYGMTLDAIAGITPVRTVDIDASRPNFDHNTRRGFFGGMVTFDAGNHRPFLYGLYQRDYNEDDGMDIGLIHTDFEYDSAYIGVGSAGALSDRLHYGVEFAYELGKSLSNSFRINPGGALVPIDQTEDDISAWAANVKLDYLVSDPNQTRLSAELTIASGDDDRGTTSSTFNGNTANTTDSAFNAFGLLNTGLAFAPDVSNIIALRGGLATIPMPDSGAFRRMQVGVDLFLFAKYDKNAPIDEITGDQRYLGWEPDVYLNWQMTSDLTFALRYGVFFPNDENFPEDDVRQFFFGGVTLAF